MPTSNRQRGFLYERFFTLKKQIAVGDDTGLPAGCNKAVALKSYSPAKLEIKREALTQAFGAGREWPWQTDDSRHEVALGDQYDLTALIAGYIVGFAFGQVATAGASAPYTHTFKVQPGIDLPVTSVIDKLPGGPVLYEDLLLSDFQISGSGSADQIINLKANWKGSGRFKDDPATFTGYTEPSLTRSSYLRMGGLSFKLGAFGAETDLAADVERFEVSFNNNPFDGHRPGSGLVAGYAEAGARREHKFSFEMLRDAADTLAGWRKNKTLLSAIVTLKADDWATSGQEVEIRIPQLVITGLDPAGGDVQTFSVQTAVLYDPDSAGYDAGAQSGVTITVKNAESAHLATLA